MTMVFQAYKVNSDEDSTIRRLILHRKHRRGHRFVPSSSRHFDDVTSNFLRDAQQGKKVGGEAYLILRRSKAISMQS